MKAIVASAVAAVAIATAPLAFAQKPDTTPDTVVEARQALMKKIAQDTKAIGSFIAGNNMETAETIAEHAGGLRNNAREIPKAFAAIPGAAGVDNDAESRAKPEIWSEWDRFVALSNRLESRAEAIRVAADNGDMELIGSIYKTMTQSCVACHDGYRVPKKKM